MIMRRKITLFVVVLLLLAILVSLGLLAEPMYPIRPGTSAEFWAHACNVALPGAYHATNGPALIRDGRCFYAVQGLHGQYLYEVTEAAAMKDFPAVQADLERRAATASAGDFGAEGYRRWKALPASRRTLPELFDYITNSLIDKIRLQARSCPFAGAMFIEAREAFHRSIDKADFYWANVLFELLFLSAWILFLAYPFWRPRVDWRLLWYWTTAPLLFYAPLWLGYAARTRSPWGPTGGILYPWLVWFSGRGAGNFDWEFVFLRHIPQLLHPISQDIDGPIMSLTGSPTRGPVHALIFSAIFCAAAWTILLLRLLAARRGSSAHGFEVIPSAQDDTP